VTNMVRFLLAYLGVVNASDSTLGSVARIGPNDLLTNDPEILRRMHNSVRTQYTRSDFYKAARMDPDRVNIAAERDDKRHTKQRMKMAPGVCYTVTEFLIASPKNLSLLGSSSADTCSILEKKIPTSRTTSTVDYTI
jgi:hypothetical protein